MGRTHYKTQTPQHSRHEKERDFRRDRLQEAPLAFGIRRPISGESSMKILMGLRKLQLVGGVPEQLRLKPRLYVPLLSLGTFGRQANQGLIRDYDIDEMQRKLKQRCPTAKQYGVEADIKRVTIRNGKEVNISLISPELDKERSKIAEVLGRYGLHGLRRDIKQQVLCTNVGSLKPLSESEREVSGNPRLISFADRRQVEMTIHQEVDEIHHVEIAIECDEWDIYPVYQRAA